MLCTDDGAGCKSEYTMHSVCKGKTEIQPTGGLRKAILSPWLAGVIYPPQSFLSGAPESLCPEEGRSSIHPAPPLLLPELPPGSGWSEGAAAGPTALMRLTF